ncbi:MAG: D-2-hydroxyacid dehydrogenase [Burkholderiales bacterium]
MSPRLLVYSPKKAGEAEQYATLVRARYPDVDLVWADTPEGFERQIAAAEVLLGWQFPAGFAARAPQLRWIHKISAGVDDLAGKLPASMILTRSDGALIAPRMVEYVLGCVFGHAQRFSQAWRQQQTRTWAKYIPDLAAGKTAGVAGLGDIGRKIAYALHRNGLRVTGWRRTAPAAAETIAGVDRIYAGPGGADGFPAFLAECDYLVLVLPLTPATRGLIDARTLAMLKAGAYVINVGRGPLIDEAALCAALGAGRLSGAALDVFVQEPLAADSPLWGLENVFMTPHVSGPVIPEDVVGHFVENLARYRAGQPLASRVEPARGY